MSGLKEEKEGGGARRGRGREEGGRAFGTGTGSGTGTDLEKRRRNGEERTRKRLERGCSEGFMSQRKDGKRSLRPGKGLEEGQAKAGRTLSDGEREGILGNLEDDW